MPTIWFILLLVGFAVVTAGCAWISPRQSSRGRLAAALIFLLYMFGVLLPGVTYLKYGTLDGDRIAVMDLRSSIAKTCHNNGNAVCW